MKQPRIINLSDYANPSIPRTEPTLKVSPGKTLLGVDFVTRAAQNNPEYPFEEMLWILETAGVREVEEKDLQALFELSPVNSTDEDFAIAILSWLLETEKITEDQIEPNLGALLFNPQALTLDSIQESFNKAYGLEPVVDSASAHVAEEIHRAIAP